MIHSCRHIGHSWFVIMCGWLSHFSIQWMWKQWLHLPDTSGQSSPGALQSAQQSSNGFLQMPQSSCFAVHFQAATPRKLLILMSICVLTLDLVQYLQHLENNNLHYRNNTKHEIKTNSHAWDDGQVTTAEARVRTFSP